MLLMDCAKFKRHLSVSFAVLPGRIYLVFTRMSSNATNATNCYSQSQAVPRMALVLTVKALLQSGTHCHRSTERVSQHLLK